MIEVKAVSRPALAGACGSAQDRCKAGLRAIDPGLPAMLTRVHVAEALQWPLRARAAPDQKDSNMALKRYATAHWEGDLNAGKGAMSTPQSGLFSDQNYSFKTRFGDDKGTNPEELLAAAHAGCFSMALSFVMQNAGVTAGRIETRADLSLEMSPAPTVTAIHLIVKASVSGLDADKFAAFAEDAKKNCVISRALSVPISMDATLL